MENEKEQESKNRSEKLLGKAFRQKQGINEKLLCMRLIQATFTNDTKNIITNTCMAASMVEEGYPKKLEGFDYRKFRIIKQMLGDLVQTEPKKMQTTQRDYNNKYADIFPIPWSIPKTKEIFEAYVRPWKPQQIFFFKAGIKKHRKTLVALSHANEWQGISGLARGCNKELETVDPSKAEQKKSNWIGKLCPHCHKPIGEDDITEDKGEHVIAEPEWSFFWEATQYLSVDGFKILRNSFMEWARDECAKAKMSMGSLVSQGVFEEISKQLKPEDEI